MADTNIGALKEWFDKLDRAQQKEVYDFLYGSTTRIYTDAYNLGPNPHLIQKGMNLGASPVASAPDKCPACGKPL